MLAKRILKHAWDQEDIDACLLLLLNETVMLGTAKLPARDPRLGITRAAYLFEFTVSTYQ